MVATALAALTAAAAVGGTALSAVNSQNASSAAAKTSSNNAQSAANSEQYQHALNAEAMKRSIAGSTDARGDQTYYDPATNTWKTKLSNTGAQLQGASDAASIKRNTGDVQTAQDANNAAMLSAIKARSAAGPALAAVQNFKPMSSKGLEGDLQETATTANRQAQAPIIADTLRQFARTGSAAAPVLTTMMRDNATSLRQTMLDDAIKAKQNVVGINAGNLSSLTDTYSKLNGASNPNLTFPQLSTSNLSDELSSQANTRAAGAAQPASTAAYSNSAATNARTAASDSAVKNQGGSNLGESVKALGMQTQSLTDKNSDFGKWLSGLFGNGSGNAGDKISDTSSSFGYAPGNYDAANAKTYG